MSELFNAPYAATNRKTLQVALRNRKLADALIESIYQLQAFYASNGGVINNFVLPASIVPSDVSPFAIDSVKFKRELTMSLNNDYLSGRIVNAIFELEGLASITPTLVDKAYTYKGQPFHASILRSLIASLANKKLGQRLQLAILELQQLMTLTDYKTLTSSADTGGVAGNITVVGDGVTDFSTLLGAGFTASAGGAEVPSLNTTITLAGGVDAIASTFSGQVAGMTTNILITADVAGVAGDVTLSKVDPVAATVVAQKLTYTAVTAGAAGNAIDIVYVDDGVAGAETVGVVGTTITVHIGPVGLKSTSNQVKAAILLSAPAIALVGVTGGDDVADQIAAASPTQQLATGADGASVTDMIATWNGGNPANEVTLTSGNGAQIPTADIVLSGGADAIAATQTGSYAVVGTTAISEPLFQ